MEISLKRTIIGDIGIAQNRGLITNLYFSATAIPQNITIRQTPLINKAFYQLNEYLAGNLQEFSLPLSPGGTNFMRQVWQALCHVPYGNTACYKDIAQAVNRPKAYRAVGAASNKNPIPIFIPCHRIIGSDGKLIGYRGGLQLKQKLLKLENQKISLNIH